MNLLLAAAAADALREGIRLPLHQLEHRQLPRGSPRLSALVVLAPLAPAVGASVPRGEADAEALQAARAIAAAVGGAAPLAHRRVVAHLIEDRLRRREQIHLAVLIPHRRAVVARGFGRLLRRERGALVAPPLALPRRDLLGRRDARTLRRRATPQLHPHALRLDPALVDAGARHVQREAEDVLVLARQLERRRRVALQLARACARRQGL
mmetsp:Transcript_41958/g.104344  ORF Transcript_41958/g.104344 Transcript_41958/m.104344 type:complete len:210 (+) Transcript_41958:1141-1770(+)